LRVGIQVPALIVSGGIMAQVVAYRTFSEVIEIPDEILETARIPGDKENLRDQVIAEWLDENDNWPNVLNMIEDDTVFYPLEN
jgi:hypothetical protein